VGVETAPQRATNSLLEILDVVIRAPLHFRRSSSPGLMVDEDEAAKAAKPPRASMAAMPIAPGRKRFRTGRTSGFANSPGRAGSHRHIRRFMGDVRARFGNPEVRSSVARR
jgi:hypothetical protein